MDDKGAHRLKFGMPKASLLLQESGYRRHPGGGRDQNLPWGVTSVHADTVPRLGSRPD
jgi:hypothetical protein